MSKVIKGLVVVNVLLLVFILTFPRYVALKSDVSRKVGEPWTGGTISTNDYYQFGKLIEQYLENIKEGLYQEAYGKLLYSYRQYQDLTSFIENNSYMEGKDFQIESISPVTTHLYDVLVRIEDEERHFGLLYDTSTFYVVPDSFLEYLTYDTTYKKDGMTYTLVSTTNYVDHFDVIMKVKNRSNSKPVTISSCNLIVGGLVPKKTGLLDIAIAPKEEKVVTISFDTSLDFPSSLEVFYTKGTKTKSYEIDLSKK